MPVKHERYEYNCAQWFRLPGPDEAIVEDPLEELEAARYFDDPVATAALKTPNARQNVVTVRRREDLGRGSALISPECIRSKKRIRTQASGSENKPPTTCNAGAAMPTKGSACTAGLFAAGPAAGGGHVPGAAAVRMAAGKRPAVTGSARARLVADKGTVPQPWPVAPAERLALRPVGRSRSNEQAVTPPTARGLGTRGTLAAAAADTAAALALATAPISPSSRGRPSTRSCSRPNAGTKPISPTVDSASRHAAHSSPPAPGSHSHRRDIIAVEQIHNSPLQPQAALQSDLVPGPISPGAAPQQVAPLQVAVLVPDSTCSWHSDASQVNAEITSTAGLHGMPAPAMREAVTLELARSVTVPPATAAASNHNTAAQQHKRAPRKSGLHAFSSAAVRISVDQPAGQRMSCAAQCQDEGIAFTPPKPLGMLSASMIALDAAAAVVASSAMRAATAAAAQKSSPGSLVSGRYVSQPPLTRVPAIRAALAALKPVQAKASTARTVQLRAKSRHSKQLTVTRSPNLHSKRRARSSATPVTTEELRLQQAQVEAAAAARLRARNAAVVGRALHGMPKLPPRAPLPLTVATTPQLRTATRARLNDSLRSTIPELPIAEQIAAFHTVVRTSLASSAAQPNMHLTLTHPQSPALRTTARLRPSRFISTEDAELAALEALPPFTARPVRCRRSMMSAGGSEKLPQVSHRPLTAFEPFHLSETNAPPAPPTEEPPPPSFTARPIPATTRKAIVPRPVSRPPLTQPQPFALHCDERAPRRAAAVAAAEAMSRQAASGARVRPTYQKGRPPLSR